MLSTYFEIQRGTCPMPMSRDAERPKTAAETRVPLGSSRFFAYWTKSAMTRPLETLVRPG